MARRRDPHPQRTLSAQAACVLDRLRLLAAELDARGLANEAEEARVRAAALEATGDGRHGRERIMGRRTLHAHGWDPYS